MIHQLKHKLASKHDAGACCCEELRCIHREKELHMERICDAWKLKTYTLTQDYFRKI